MPLYDPLELKRRILQDADKNWTRDRVTVLQKMRQSLDGGISDDEIIETGEILEEGTKTRFWAWWEAQLLGEINKLVEIVDLSSEDRAVAHWCRRKIQELKYIIMRKSEIEEGRREQEETRKAENQRERERNSNPV